LTTQLHECPAPGCTERVDFSMFACQRHWFSIPKPLRDEIWRTWRKRLEAHAAARKAGVEFLEAETRD